MPWIKNISLVAVSLILSLALAEVFIRAVLGGPDAVGSKSKRFDDNFGFKVSPDFPGIDLYGFRNESKKWKGYRIAAIGDSHTYGYNVSSKDSWPAKLEKFSEELVYNFGIGGNGVYSYHFLVMAELQKNKEVIVGLYVPNDFKNDPYVCAIDFTNKFWTTEKRRLNLELPRCDLKISDETLLQGNFETFLYRLAYNSSLVHLIKRHVYLPWVERSHNSQVPSLKLGGNFEPIRYSRLKSHLGNTDLVSHDVRTVFNDFKKMLAEWRRNSKLGQLGIVIIPSRQLVYRYVVEHFNTQIASDGFAELRALTENELHLENRLVDLITDAGIPVQSSRSAIAGA